MSLWRQLRRGLANLWDRTPRDREIVEEVAHYREALVADGIARGLTPEDARRAAQWEMRGETQLGETVRQYGWERTIACFIEDVRYGWRGLRSDRSFSLVAVATIAVGIGASTAIVSAVRPALFDSLPYPSADRVRAIVEHAADGTRIPGTFGMYRALADRAQSLEQLAVFAPWSPALTGDARPERLVGQRVSSSFFRVLGVAPAVGRDLHADDDRPNSVPVAIISDGLWRRRFAADTSIIGRVVRLDDVDVTVIGVMPASFENVVEPAAEAWTTLRYELTQGRAWGHHLSTIGRFRAGVNPGAAEGELNVLAARVINEQRPPTYGANLRWSAPSLQQDLTRDVKPALLAVLVAVGVVLVLACVNVTNLLLVRGSRRREEFALRAALGASRPRLIRQVLTEGLLLAGLGGALGVVVAYASVGAIVAATPAGLPRAHAIAVDWPLLLFAIVLTTITGVLVGLLPALQASRQDQLAIDLATTRITGGRRRLLRSSLVAFQVAFALVLLIGGGLLLRSMNQLLAVSPGFDARNVVTMQLQISPRRYADAGAPRRFFDDVREAVQRVPGVTAVATTSQLPMSGDHDAYGVTLESPSEIPVTDDREIFRYAVSPGYLELMRIPVRAGRTLDASDREDAPRAVVVNESFARRYLGERDPIGQRLWIGPTNGEPYTVVGVVGDIKQLSLAGDVPDAVYITAAQWRFDELTMSLVVRATQDAELLVPAVRDAVWSVDSDLPIVRVATMESLVDRTSAERRFILLLFQLFAVAALVLTMAGIYGMMAGLVAERTRELGVRAAVGASAAQIIGIVMAFGARVTGVGVVVGIAGAVAGTRLMESMLYGVTHLDVVTYGAVVLVVAVLATVACAVPAMRAARLDPAQVLRG